MGIVFLLHCDLLQLVGLNAVCGSVSVCPKEASPGFDVAKCEGFQILGSDAFFSHGHGMGWTAPLLLIACIQVERIQFALSRIYSAWAVTSPPKQWDFCAARRSSSLPSFVGGCLDAARV